MKGQRLVMVLMLANTLLLILFVGDRTRALFAAQSELPVLRGRALEIVDEHGLVRASIKVHGPEMVNGVQYGGGVVLVMGDPRGAPGVKLAASDSSAGLGLSNGRRLPDGRSAGIQLHAGDSRVVLIDIQGHEKTLRP